MRWKALQDDVPALGIFDCTVLDALQLFLKAFSQLAGLPVVEDPFHAIVGEAFDGGDASGSSCDEAFYGAVHHLLDGEKPFLHLLALLPGQVNDAGSGDAGKDGVPQLRGYQDAVFQQEENVAGGALLDVFLLYCIQIDHLHEACLLGLLLCKGGDDVVGGTLDPAGAVGRGPDAVGGDCLGVAALEVGGDAGGTDDDIRFLGDADADSGLAVHVGPHVDGAGGGKVVLLPTAVVVGDIAQSGVAADEISGGLEVELLWEGGAIESLHGLAEAASVLIRAEDADLSILLGIGLHALEAAVAVLAGVGYGGNAQLVAVGDDLLSLRLIHSL